MCEPYFYYCYISSTSDDQALDLRVGGPLPYCMLPFIWNIQNKQIYKDRKHISGCCQGLGEVETRVTPSTLWGPRGHEKVWNQREMMVAQFWMHEMPWVIRFKTVHCVLCEFHIPLNTEERVKDSVVERRGEWEREGGRRYDYAWQEFSQFKGKCDPASLKQNRALVWLQRPQISSKGWKCHHFL